MKTVAVILVAVAAWVGCGQDMNAETLTAINVSAFGAQPGDGRDDTVAFRKAAEACRQKPGSRLILEPGQYDFGVGKGLAEKSEGLRFHDCRDLSIEGNGAVLMFRGLTRAFDFSSCTNVSISGLTVDWARPPHSTGRVVAVTNDSFDVEILPEFPVQGGEPIQAFQDFDPETEFHVPAGLDAWYCVKSTELIRPQVLRVHIDRAKDPSFTERERMRPGMLLGMRHQVYGYEAFFSAQCHGMRLTDVTIHTCPGMAFLASHGGDFAFKRCRVMRRPNTKWLISGTADGFDFTSCRGPIRMEDCLWEGQGDDAINVHGIHLVVVNQLNARTVEVVERCYNWDQTAEPGSRIEFLHPTTMQTFGQAVVKACSSRSAEPQRIYTIEFEADLPMELGRDDFLLNVDRIGADIQIRRCTVRRNRARGFLIQTRNAVVEDCVFDHDSMSGLLVCAGPDGEAGAGRDIAIRRNRFVGVNRVLQRDPMCEAAIAVYSSRKGQGLPPAGVFRGITIEDNVFEDTDYGAICLASTDGAVIRNNRISGTNRRAENPFRARRPDLPPAGQAAIFLTQCRNVKVTDNSVDGHGMAAGTRPIVVGPGCDAATVVVDLPKQNAMEQAH